MAPPVDPGATSVVAATTAVPAADGGGTGAQPAYYDDEDDEPKRSSGLFLAALIVLLIVLAGMLFLLSKAARLRRGRHRRRQAGRGAQRDRRAGRRRPADPREPRLRGRRSSQEANDDQEEGNVFDQDPERGEKVDEGSTVTLKVSAGAAADPGARRHRLAGRAGPAAARGRRASRWSWRRSSTRRRPSARWSTRSPGANEEAPQGSEVKLFVSSGPADRPVPDVVGRTIAEASNLLGQAGFAVNQTSEASNTVEEGRVIRTDPPADTVRPKGDADHGGRVERAGRGQRARRVDRPHRGQRHRHRSSDAGFVGRRSRASSTGCADLRTVGSSPGPRGNTTAPAGSTVTIVRRCQDPPRRRRRRRLARADRRRAGLAEEVAQQVVPADGEDRLGVELHALDGQLPVAQAHHDAVVGLGGDLEAVGHRRPVDHEAVVAGRLERLRAARRTRRRPRWRISEVLPCITCGARTTSPPYTWPMHWWPRHTPSTGTRPPKVVITSFDTPGVVGRARARGDQHGVGLERRPARRW